MSGDEEASGRLSFHGLPAACLIPGYEVLEELGRGGMGVVYKARQVRLNRVVALKMILAGGTPGPRSAPVSWRGRGDRGASSIPDIVQVYDFGDARRLALLRAGVLSPAAPWRQLAKARRCRRARRRTLVEQSARAVQAAHEQGIVHRDLKPANCCWTPDGTPKVTRLRPGQAAGGGPGLHPDRGRHGHAVVHGPGAGQRQARTSARPPTSTPWGRSSTSA